MSAPTDDSRHHDVDDVRLRTRLGGRWAISLRGYVIGSVGVVVALLLGSPYALRSASVTGGLLVVAVVVCAVRGAILLTAARLPVFRRRADTPAPILTVTALAATSVLASAAVVDVLTRRLGLPSGPGGWTWYVSMLVIGVPTALMLILLLDQIDRSHRLRHRLADLQVLVELARLQQSLLASDIRLELAAQVSASLEPARAALRAQLDATASAPSAASIGALAASLRHLADDAVRPLSARLWAQSMPTDDVQQTGRLAVLRAGICPHLRAARLQPVALVPIYVVGNASTLIITFGEQVALTMLAVGAALIVGIALASNAVSANRSAWRPVPFLVGVAALQVATLPFAAWRNAAVPGTGSLAWIALQIGGGLALIAVTSGVASWQHVEREVRVRMLRDLAGERVRALAHARLLADITRDAARHLHGSWQTRLVACAMTSERAIADEDVELLAAAFEETRAILASEVMGSSSSEAGTRLGQSISSAIAPWDELCAFEVTVDAASNADTGAISQVIEEAVTNAIRHGGATSIQITVTAAEADGDLLVIVEDDGGGLDAGAHGRRGIGMAVLDQVTGGRWRIEPTADGSRLRAVVPAPHVDHHAAR